MQKHQTEHIRAVLQALDENMSYREIEAWLHISKTAAGRIRTAAVNSGLSTQELCGLDDEDLQKIFIRRQAKYVLIRTGNRFTAFSNEKKSHFKCFSLSTKSRLKGKPTLTRHIADATTSGSRPTAFSVSKATHNACPVREWKSTLSRM